MKKELKDMPAVFQSLDTHHVGQLSAFVKGGRLMIDTNSFPQCSSLPSGSGAGENRCLHPEIERWANKAGGTFKRSKENADILIFEIN